MSPERLLAGRFTLESPAGSGGMGEVWRARDGHTGDTVAVKLMRGEAREHVERFAREALVLAELRHPRIVRYLAHGATPAGEPYLVMEWLDGEDLAVRLQRGGLSLAETVELTRLVAGALGAAHARGIVHRDLKPRNLFLVNGRVDEVKLLDFGVARADDGRGLTASGVRVGTPAYMAPEQVRGDRVIRPAADVYALGVLLFDCVTGRLPFEGGSPAALLARLFEDAPRLSEIVGGDVPADLDELCARFLARAAAERPPDGAAAAAALEALAPVSGSPRAAARPIGSSITKREQVVLSVVLAADAAAHRGSTVRLAIDDDDVIAELAAAHGGRAERLPAGLAVIVLPELGAASDRVARAARCALDVHARAGGVVVVATGRGTTSPAAGGEVVERAVRLFREAGDTPRVLLDDATAALLAPRFEVTDGVLIAARDPGGPERALLGKPMPCLGRARELGLLAGLLDECLEERVARAVLVVAPEGGGKSRLAAEVVARARERAGLEIWRAYGDALRSGAPYAMLGDAVGGAATIRDADPPATRRRKLEARVALRQPAEQRRRVSELLGEMCRAPFPVDAGEDRPALRAARADPRVMADQLRRAWDDFLAGECAAHPVLLVLDDLHWADAPTVKAIDASLRAAEERPLLVLALARPEVHRVFPSLWAGRGVVELPLPPLNKKAGERLVREALGDALPAAVAERIVARSGGNPFFLEELIRAVAQGREEAPASVLATVQARLERLDPRARQLLRAASVYGRAFSAEAVAALTGGAPEAEWLEQLADEELLERQEGGRYNFSHALVRDAAYAMLDGGDREVGHRLAGAFLEKAGSEAVVLAEHFERGGDRARAATHYAAAARAALAGNDLEAVLARVERGIACGAEGPLLGRLLLARAEASLFVNRLDQQLADALAAAALLEPGSDDHCRALGEAGFVGGRTSDRRVVAEVAAACRALDPSARAAAVARTRVAGEATTAGVPELAAPLLEGVDVNDAAVAPWWHRLLAFRARLAGDEGEVLRQMTAAAARLELVGAERDAWIRRVVSGFTALELGAGRLAEQIFRAELAHIERLGLAVIAPPPRAGLRLALLRRGAVDEARAVPREDLGIPVGAGDFMVPPAWRARLLALPVLSDDPLAEARAAVALLHGTASHALAGAALARVLLGAGDVDGALRASTDAVATLADTELPAIDEPWVRGAHAAALRAAGRLDEARAEAERARARLLVRAARIGDAGWSKSYLEGVPENARVLGDGAP